MNLQFLLDNIETLAEAYDGVSGLRLAVFQLAVFGGFSGQPIIADRYPADIQSATETAIPTDWRWQTISEIAEHQLGKMLNTKTMHGDPVPYLRSVNIQWSGVEMTDTKTMLIPADERDRYSVKPGDLFVCEGGEVGRSAVWQGAETRELAFQNALHRLRFSEEYEPKFFNLAIRVAAADGVISNLASGVTIQHFSKSKLVVFPVPVPPADEQHRIVAKVDEMMALIDRYEAAKNAREESRKAFRDSALQALQDAEDAGEVQKAWKLVSENIEEMFVEPEDLDELRQAVIDLSMSGSLTTSGMKSQWARSHAAVDESTMADALVAIEAGRSPKASSEPRKGQNWGVLKVSAVSWGKFLPDENKAMYSPPESRNREVKCGDFIISRANTMDLVARSVVVESTPPFLMLSDKTLRLVPKEDIDSEYLHLANSCTAARDYYSSVATGTSVSMKNVSQKAILGLPLRLPSYEMQKEIVTITKSHLELIEKLALHLRNARVTLSEVNQLAI